MEERQQLWWGAGSESYISIGNMSSDLSLDKHTCIVSTVCSGGGGRFYVEFGDLSTMSLRLRLFHALVTSRIDYCNAILVGAPKCLTDKFQLVLNVVARVVSITKRFDRDLTHLMHAQLHWFNFLQLLGRILLYFFRRRCEFLMTSRLPHHYVVILGIFLFIFLVK